MEVTGKDILNLVCAYKIIKTETHHGYYLCSTHTKNIMSNAIDEAIEKYRAQLKES